ncbi:MAG TPA: PEP-CTERM system TPR-repeat protein PrsT [Thiobacillus sp.]|nr:PEP-CTERM system TPR-repeat protein PrsT [Thiobacillus sp.]
MLKFFPRILDALRAKARAESYALLAGLLVGLGVSPLALADREAQAARYYEDALARYERRDDAGAIIQLKNALKEDARMLPALVLLGQAHLRKGEPAAAERVFADAERLGAARGQIAVYQAQAYLDQGKSRALLEKFGADGLAPQARLDMLLLRARAQISLSQLDAAMTGARQAEQIKGGEARALALQAQIHLKSGRAREAGAAVQRALQLSPRNADAWNMQASIAHTQGDLQAAARDYGRALEAQPLHLDARLARAAVYLDLQRDNDAKADIDYLLRHFAYDPRGAYLRALYYSRRGDAAGARTALQEATRTLGQLSPEFLAASDQLTLLGGLAHHALGEFERAKTYLNAYLGKHPREAGARKLLGSIYLAERQFERAVAMLQPALSANPDDARAMSMLGAAYMGLGNHGKAALLFQEAAHASDSPDIQAGLGISLLSTGQKEAGFDALLRAYRQAPATSQTGVPLALAYLKRGEAGRAVAIVEEILKREPGNISTRNLLGVAKLATGDRAGARAAYVAAIQAAPSFYTAHLNLARLDEADGQLERARQRYLGILKVRPGHADAMLELARLEEGAGRVDEAIRWLDKARSLRGQDVRAPLALHGLYLRLGRAQQALEAAKDAQAIAPNHPAALMALAQGQIAVGNPDLAKTTLRRLTQAAAFNASWLTQTAARQMQIGDTESAAYSLSKALLADAGFRPARMLQARLNVQTGKLDEAEKQAQALLAQGSAQAEALRLLGEIRLAQQRKSEAVEAYRRAYADDAGSDSLFGLYGALLATSQAPEAARLMADWRGRHPADRPAAHALGEAWLALGDATRARAVYRELVLSDPKDARAHNNLANVLLQQGDPAALRHAEQAHALAPSQPQVNDTLGWVLVQQGQVEKGLRYLREAALRAPDDPDIRAHVDQALLKMRR